MSAPPSTVGEAVADVRARVEAACRQSARDPRSVTIVAASKTVDIAGILAAARCGITDFGENRVQEALPKISALSGPPDLRWHFIGRLQRNKARTVAEHFDAVHSVDSEALLVALGRSAARPLDVFLQVNLTGAPAQGGSEPEELEGLIDVATRFNNIRLAGLMTIGVNAPDPEASRPVFRRLAELARSNHLAGLSMGMTGDFEVAISEGATHIRVGRALFGERHE